MKKTVIFGVTPFSFLIREDMEADGHHVSAFTVNRAYLPEKWEDSAPLVAFEDLDTWAGEDGFEVIVTVGYKKMNEHRKAVFDQCRERGYEIGSFIHSRARCEAAKMGVGNILLEGSRISRFSVVGDGNIFVNDTVIGHESEVGSFNFFAGMTTGGIVHIGDHCFLGMKSIVCNNIRVGSYTLLGAGTVLSKDSEEHMVVMPAKNRTMKLDLESMDSLLV